MTQSRVLFICVHNSGRSQMAEAFLKAGRLYDYVVSVCDDSNDARCPVFPGITQRLHWPFPDPEGLSGTREIISGHIFHRRRASFISSRPDRTDSICRSSRNPLYSHRDQRIRISKS